MEDINENLIPEAENLLEFLGLDHLPEEQKVQVLDGLMSHLSEIIIENLSDNLSEEQAEDLQRALSKNPTQAQQRIQEISSRIPGLYFRIQVAIRDELEILKASYEQVSKN